LTIREFDKLVITKLDKAKTYWCRRVERSVDMLPVQVVMNRCLDCDKKYTNYKRASKKADLLAESNQTINPDTYLWLVTITLDGKDDLRVPTSECRITHKVMREAHNDCYTDAQVGYQPELEQDIEKARKELMKRFRRIRDRSPMFTEWIQGGLYALEFKSKKGDLHPHIHMVCMIDKEKLTDRGLLPKDAIKMFKKEAVKYKFGKYVNVRRIDKLTTKNGIINCKPTNKDSIRRAVKYAVKYAVKESGNNKRTTGWFGNMYGRHKEECRICMRRFCPQNPIYAKIENDTPSCRQSELAEFITQDPVVNLCS
jgi:hypothetical protein